VTFGLIKLLKKLMDWLQEVCPSVFKTFINSRVSLFRGAVEGDPPTAPMIGKYYA
jgi:hypothetical protein